eukprot:1115471-Pyramimonas_sp.AAC.2
MSSQLSSAGGLLPGPTIPRTTAPELRLPWSSHSSRSSAQPSSPIACMPRWQGGRPASSEPPSPQRFSTTCLRATGPWPSFIFFF